MKIAHTRIHIQYSQVNQIVKKFVNLETNYLDDFKPANINDLPDDIDCDIPRIVTETVNGHSLLGITPEYTFFDTNYDNGFEDDWDACTDYLNEKSNIVYHLTNDLTENKEPQYFGLITNIEYNELNENSLNTLKQSLFVNKGAKLGNPDDLFCGLNYLVEDKYNLNISLQIIPVVNEEGVKEREFIGVTVDVNDRHMLIQNKEYSSNLDEYNKLVDITTNVIKNKLKDLIEKGEFNYD